jgi:hypothetical protein
VQLQQKDSNNGQSQDLIEQNMKGQVKRIQDENGSEKDAESQQYENILMTKYEDKEA